MKTEEQVRSVLKMIGGMESTKELSSIQEISGAMDALMWVLDDLSDSDFIYDSDDES